MTQAHTEAGWNFDNSYASLPDTFFTKQNPTPVRSPQLVIFNRPLAAALGLQADALNGQAGAEVFAGNRIPAGQSRSRRRTRGTNSATLRCSETGALS